MPWPHLGVTVAIQLTLTPTSVASQYETSRALTLAHTRPCAHPHTQLYTQASEAVPEAAYLTNRAAAYIMVQNSPRDTRMPLPRWGSTLGTKLLLTLTPTSIVPQPGEVAHTPTPAHPLTPSHLHEHTAVHAGG